MDISRAVVWDRKGHGGKHWVDCVVKVRCKVCAPTTLSKDLGCRMLAARPKPFHDIIGAGQLVYGWDM